MQNMNMPLFCILDLGPAYFLTYICKIICKIIVAGSYVAYSAYCNMQNMPNMEKKLLKYATLYVKYAKQYAKK